MSETEHPKIPVFVRLQTAHTALVEAHRVVPKDAMTDRKAILEALDIVETLLIRLGRDEIKIPYGLLQHFVPKRP